MDATQSDLVTSAVAFVQVKISGRLGPRLERNGTGGDGWLYLGLGEHLAVPDKMIADLQSFVQKVFASPGILCYNTGILKYTANALRNHCAKGSLTAYPLTESR